MFVRLALDHEEDEFVRLTLANMAETMPDEPHSEIIIRQTFRDYLATAAPTIWFCEHQRQCIGVMVSYIRGYDYRDGHYTTQRILYVSPENRGTRAAVLLIKELIRWSVALGADRIEGGNDNSFQSDRTAAFLTHFGFERVGFAMRKNLRDSDSGR